MPPGPSWIVENAGFAETHDQRRLELTGVASLIAMATCWPWLLAQLAIGETAAWITIGCGLFYGVAAWESRGPKARLAPHLLCLTVIAHVMLACHFGHGVLSGSHRWFVVLVVGPFLILAANERYWAYAYALFGSGAGFLIDLGVIGERPPLPALAGFSAQHTSALNSILIALSLFGILHSFVTELRRGQRLNEKLLLNTLPSTILARLQNGEENIADRIPRAGVLFADLVGFTPLAARVTPVRLVSILDGLFTEFDREVSELRLEKIKTIGDAYMVASGVPGSGAFDAAALGNLALAMNRIVDQMSQELDEPLLIRIGIHVGPVVGGIIGQNKFCYDLWGETVNTASRLEAGGAPSQIHVSREFQEACPRIFSFEARGRVALKGIGDRETFFLRSAAPRILRKELRAAATRVHSDSSRRIAG